MFFGPTYQSPYTVSPYIESLELIHLKQNRQNNHVLIHILDTWPQNTLSKSLTFRRNMMFLQHRHLLYLVEMYIVRPSVEGDNTQLNSEILLKMHDICL